MRPFYARIERHQVQYVKVNAEDREDAKARADKWFTNNNGERPIIIEVIDPLAIEILEINPTERGGGIVLNGKKESNEETA